MTKPPRKGGGKHLDDDDHALWRHTAQSVKPLAKAKGRHHPAAEQVEAKAIAAAAAKAKARTDAKAGKVAAVAVTPASQRTSVQAAQKPQPAAAAIDRKKVRKIRSGQVEIEARIDLHGMRQAEAHVALIRFLHRCQSRDQRWVLVITGKGKASDHDHYAPFDMHRHSERGVLKRNVPRWLEEPDLRPLVVSYTTAAIAHGGEGALYVHLRKRR